jgi:hypothetical protein
MRVVMVRMGRVLFVPFLRPGDGKWLYGIFTSHRGFRCATYNNERM